MSGYHNYQEGTTAKLTLGEVAWFPELNCRKKYNAETKTFKNEPAEFDPNDPETKTLIASLQDRGYDPQYPAVVGPITDEQKADAVKRLEEKWSFYKQAAKLSPSALTMATLIAFEFFYTLPKGKKGERVVRAPDYLGCTGNRRSECVFNALILRLVEAQIGNPKKEIVADPDVFAHPERVAGGLTMSCVVESFADADARQIRQIAENEAKTEGFKRLSPVEVVLNYYEGVVTGRITQVRIRESQKDGEGQKIYGFIILAARFLKLRWLERLLKPAEAIDHINWSKLPQGAGDKGFPATIRDSNEYTHRQFVEKMEKEGKADKITPFLDEQGVEGRLKEWMTGKKNESKVMAKPVVQELQKNNPCILVRNISQDYLEVTRKEIDILTAKAPAFNSLRALVDSSCFNQLNELLGVVEGLDESQRLAYLVKLSEVQVPEAVVAEAVASEAVASE